MSDTISYGVEVMVEVLDGAHAGFLSIAVAPRYGYGRSTVRGIFAVDNTQAQEEFIANATPTCLSMERLHAEAEARQAKHDEVQAIADEAATVE